MSHVSWTKTPADRIVSAFWGVILILIAIHILTLLKGNFMSLMFYGILVLIVFFGFAFFMSRRHSDDMYNFASALVDMGLALIGRKTRSGNTFFTEKIEKSRHIVESPFLDYLFEKFKDEERRKILMLHFMEFKEMCLFKVFFLTLRDNPTLYKIVCHDLYEKLSEGLSTSEQNQKSEYQATLTKHFNEAFNSVKEVQWAIRQSFWNTVIEKHPHLFTPHDSLNLWMNQCLCNIFLDTYEFLAGVIKEESQ